MKRLISWMLVSCLFMPHLVLAKSKFKHHDLPNKHFGKAAIEELISRNIIEDRSQVFPDQPIKRVEFIKMVIEAIEQLDQPDFRGIDQQRLNFSDLDRSQWYLPFVTKAVELNLVKGYDDGTLRPGSKVNRAEAVTILYRAFFGDQSTSSALNFEDVKSQDWFFEEVKVLVNKGIVKGQSAKKFAPFSKLTRAEAAVLISRIFQLRKNKSEQRREPFSSQLPPTSDPQNSTELPLEKEQKTENHLSLLGQIKARKAMWVWHDDMMYEAKKTDDFVNWAESHRIEILYFNAYPFLTDGEERTDKQLADFIKTVPFKFELLLGEHKWTYDQHHLKVREFVQQADQFVKKYDLEDKVLGIHLDVEPDTLPTWTTDEENTMRSFLNLLKVVQQDVDKTHFYLNVDIANWFEIPQLRYDGDDKKFYKHIIDQVDMVTIMDYTDRAEGDSGMIERAKDEIQYANLVEKKIWVGAEINQLPGGKKAKQYTFFEEGFEAMVRALDKVDRAFRLEDSYQGVVIHDYVGMKKALE